MSPVVEGHVQTASDDSGDHVESPDGVKELAKRERFHGDTESFLRVLGLFKQGPLSTLSKFA